EIEAANISWHGFSLSPPLSAADAAFEASNCMDSDITRHLVPIHAARAAQDALGSTGGECAAQAVLLRDILGNPFHPPRPPPAAVSAWNHRTLAYTPFAICVELASDRLSVLADALEEAGCLDTDILGHCRQEGKHVRGCWVVDLILGKK